MKTLLSFFAVLLIATTSFATAVEAVEVPAMKTLKLAYDAYAGKSVKIFNRSDRQIDISVIDRETGKQVKGFGLNKKASEVVYIDEGLVLTLRNNTLKPIEVDLKIVTTQNEPKSKGDVYITFTMRNSSAKSIPLMIPGVMNPNLSPFSNSGVSLKIGQKVYFKHNGRKEVLLTVDETIENGQKLDMAAVVKSRKSELNAK